MTQAPGRIAPWLAGILVALLSPADALLPPEDTRYDAAHPWGTVGEVWPHGPTRRVKGGDGVQRGWPEFEPYLSPEAPFLSDKGLMSLSADAAATTLALGDLDGDRRSDLVIAYQTGGGGLLALHRGNPESHLYRSQEKTPFMSPARLFSLPLAADFLAIGDFDNDGYADVAATAIGSDALYLMAGDGNGGLANPETIWLSGPVIATASGEVNRRDGRTDLVLGVDTGSGSELQIFQDPRGALTRDPERVPLPAAIERILLGNLDTGSERDIAAIAGDALFFVSGRQPVWARQHEPAEKGMEFDRITLPFPVAGAALNHNQELALWSGDGNFITASLEALLSGAFDVVDQGLRGSPGGGLSAQLSHAPGRELLLWNDKLMTALAGEGGSNDPLKLELSGSIRGVAADYLDGDGLMDLVVVTAKSPHPMVLLSHKGGGFEVNSLADSSDSDIGDDICDIQSPPMPPPNNICTLRAAIQESTTPASMGGTISSSVNGTIMLTLNLPVISKPLTIMGGNTLEVTGSGLANTAFRVVPGGQLTLSGMSVYIASGVAVQSSVISPPISDNLIRDNAFGVTHAGELKQATLVSFSDSTGNLVQNNRINGSISIFGARSAKNTLSGNILASELAAPETGTFSVSLNSSPGSNVVDNFMTGMIVNDNAQGTSDVLIRSNAVGVDLTGGLIGAPSSRVLGLTVRGTNAADVTLDSNEVAGQTGNGIVNGGDRPIVRFNESHDNTNIGIIINGDQALVTDNTAQDNGGRGMDVLATNSQIINNRLLDNSTAGSAANMRANLSGSLVEDNVITGGGGVGAELTGGGPSPDAALFINNVVENNAVGIRVAGLHDARIADNSVAANLGHGVEIQNSFQTVNVELQRNEIIVNQGDGVRILGGQGATIGGPGGDGNTIANNGGAGISASGGAGFDIGGNAIFENGGLGIDLAANGLPEANDPGDADGGANGLQNFPVITSIVGGISATLNSTPSAAGQPPRSFRIDAYGNGFCDPSGFGEGRSFLTSTTVTTDANGNANIALNVAANVVTLTATDLSTNSTSEFSDCRSSSVSKIVNSDGDMGDASPGDNSCFTGQLNNEGDPECTLRAAIEEINDLPGYDVIAFNIPPSHGLTISPPTLLDAVSEGVNIDATTQPTGMVVLDGSLQPGTSIGLQLLGDGSFVTGLGVTGFVKGIVLTDAAMGRIRNNRFTLNSLAVGIEGQDSTGNLVGLNEFDVAMFGGELTGNGTAVRISNAPGNTVLSNVILGSGVGVEITGAPASGNSVLFNDIGIRVDDDTVAGNDIGVAIDNAPSSIVGDNVIVAGAIEGINVDGAQAVNTRIQGNLIGTDHRRLPGLGNGERGISIRNAPGTQIGGQAVVDENVIVGNGLSGSMKGGPAPPPDPDLDGIFMDNADGTVIEGNFIGITDTGVKMGNGRHGIYMTDSSDVTVGGRQLASRNVISANGVNGFGDGILISGAGSVDVLVAGNYIGVGVDGSSPAGNADQGIDILSAGPNRIEGDPDNYPQVISSNGDDGIRVQGNKLPAVAENPVLGQTIRGNIIGSDFSGTAALANGRHGVFLSASSDNLIEDNLISGNNGDGIALKDAGILDPSFGLINVVKGNKIGTTMGMFPLGNFGHGISADGKSAVAIGDATKAGAANTIAFNNLDGINAQGPTYAAISGNQIYTNGRLGINLVDIGEPAGTVTPNDHLDMDTGPNTLANFPVNISVTVIPGTNLHVVRGTVSTEANTGFGIEFFDSDLCDPSGNGEGQRWLGSVDTGTTDGFGQGSFVKVFLAPLQVVTTTMGINLGSTSEFSPCAPVPPPVGELLVNEVDASSGGLEFIELFHTAGGTQPLAGYSVVLYDGVTDLSYAAFDLDGLFTDVNGYFVLGDGNDPVVDLALPADILQDGADAVALYQADALDFPDGTPVTTDDVVDALVYDSGQSDDDALLMLLNEFQPQVNEAGSSDLANHSNQRCPNGAGGGRNTDLYAQAPPTAGAENACIVCTLTPATAGRDIADPHTVTATVLSDRVNPLVGVDVTFAVTDGPALGASGVGTTGAPGTADFTLNSAGVGIDTITASGLSDGIAFSCAATVQWSSEVVFSSGFEDPPQP